MNIIDVIIPLPSERQQFSKELYDKDPSTWKVEDRKGRAVRILCTDKGGTDPIVAIDYEDDVCTYSSDGKFNQNITEESNLDLFMRPISNGVTIMDKWINLYVGHMSTYASQKDADNNSGHARIAMLHLKFRNV